MFVVTDTQTAILFCILTMIGWGSWANTQKLAGRRAWPFSLYYWDYALGVFLCGAFLMLTAGSNGAAGVGAVENLRLASPQSVGHALASGALFNLANILLVVAIDRAGMAVAFPVGVGLALVIGTVASYVQNPVGDPVLLSLGVAAVCAAMVLSAAAHRRLRNGATDGRNGVVFACLAGLLMGFFYPELVLAISPHFESQPIASGLLTPYTALFFFGIGLILSNALINTVFMRSQAATYRQYFAADAGLHLLGLAGGLIWTAALAANLIASGVAGPAVSYALGQGATLVAAIWGVFIWREFKSAPASVNPLLAGMFIAYGTGLGLIGSAIL